MAEILSLRFSRIWVWILQVYSAMVYGLGVHGSYYHNNF